MLDAVVIAALVGVFLLVAGFGGLMVHRLVRATADPAPRGERTRPSRRTSGDG